MAFNRDIVEHLAHDTGLKPEEIDGSSALGDRTADHLATDTGVPAEELTDERGGPAAPFAGAVNPD